MNNDTTRMKTPIDTQYGRRKKIYIKESEGER